MACQGDCTVDGCLRPARRSGLCWAHLWRRAHGRPLGDIREQGQTPKQVLLEAVYDFVDTDASDRRAWRKAWDRLRKAAVRYAVAPKPNDPTRRR